MPLPKGLARFNRVVTNRITGPFAARLPGFAIVIHVGRRSGREYSNPVNLFRRGDRYVIALTYGADSQWVRNVMAAGEARLITRGQTIQLIEPEILHDATRSDVPAPVRPVLGWLDVSDFMVLRRRSG
jgi:deazaflavin-dependent oxidoreductase (nitroreductase family)